MPILMRTSAHTLPHRIVVALILLILLLAAPAALTPGHAATESRPAGVQAAIEALSRANEAVVGIRVTAAEGALSAETLGTEREGSGVVINSDGLVLTIGYLMLEAQQIEIITQDNRHVPATPVAYDIATGFGLVRSLLPLRGVTPVKLGRVQDLQTGEALMAATGGDEGDVSMTRLVSKRAFSGAWEYHIDSALFTSPPVMTNGGNHSGAPLFNSRGELVGIASLLVMDAMGENRRVPGNMFVPVDLLKPVLAEMQKSGTSHQSHRPWLGVTSNDRGGRVQIMRVSAGSPAETGGLQAGQVVMAVDGSEVTTLESFYKKLWKRGAPDAPVTLTVRQGEEVKTIVLRPQDRLLTLKKPAGI